MKHKVFIAKVLTIGIVLNSLSVLSYANTEIPNRYQTLEGEFITIDDSTADEFHEIEIFGNTVQDENNLNNIQSVGDLYVDEDGNPILDNQGREQYKIEIASSNLIPSSISFEEFSTLTPSNIQGFTAFPIDNIEYVIAKLNDDSILNPSSLGIKIYHTKLVLGEELKIIPDSTLEHCLPFYNWSTINSSTGKEDILEALRLGHLELSIKIKNKPLAYSNLSGLTKSNKKTIISPCQLQKVGDIADRLYWDNEKGRYVIEKNIDKVIIETNITSKLKLPTYEDKTHIYAETENGVNPTLKITIYRLLEIAKSAVEEAEMNSTIDKISLARMYVNMLPESLYKDQLHEQLNQIFSSDMVLEKKTTTSNTDIYIKPKNTLSMSLDTNSIVFEGYSGTEDMEMLNAVNITINSSLPYSLNAYMPTAISNSDNSSTMDINVLNIKESNETNYQIFASTTDKVVLKDNCADGSSNNHSIDLKLASNQTYAADIYKTVIKFEAEQK